MTLLERKLLRIPSVEAPSHWTLSLRRRRRVIHGALDSRRGRDSVDGVQHINPSNSAHEMIGSELLQQLKASRACSRPNFDPLHRHLEQERESVLESAFDSPSATSSTRNGMTMRSARLTDSTSSTLRFSQSCRQRRPGWEASVSRWSLLYFVHAAREDEQIALASGRKARSLVIKDHGPQQTVETLTTTSDSMG